MHSTQPAPAAPPQPSFAPPTGLPKYSFAPHSNQSATAVPAGAPLAPVPTAAPPKPGRPAPSQAKQLARPDKSPPKAEQVPIEVQAQRIQDFAGGAYLRNSSLMSSLFDVTAYKVVLDKLLEDCGNPTDPIQRMMVEQLAFAHHACGYLHVRAAQVPAYEAAVAFTTAAARLMAEFRRSAIVLQQLRAGSSPGLRAIGAEETDAAARPARKRKRTA